MDTVPKFCDIEMTTSNSQRLAQGGTDEPWTTTYTFEKLNYETMLRRVLMFLHCVLALLIVITCGASVYTATNGNMCAKVLNNQTQLNLPCELGKWPPANVVITKPEKTTTTTTSRPFIINELEAKMLQLATCPIMRSIEPHVTRFCTTSNTSHYSVHSTLRYNYLKIEVVKNV